jgi:hypothetical protein
MAALSVAAEFLSVKSPQGPLSDMSMLEVKQKIEAMHTVLDSALRRKKICSERPNSFDMRDSRSKLRPPCGVRDCHIFLEPFMCIGCGIMFDGRERR